MNSNWYRSRTARDWAAFVGCVFVFLFATASALHALDPPVRVLLSYQPTVLVHDMTGADVTSCTWVISTSTGETYFVPEITLDVPSEFSGGYFTVTVTGTETNGSGTMYITVFNVQLREPPTTTTTAATTTTTIARPGTTTTSTSTTSTILPTTTSTMVSTTSEPAATTSSTSFVAPTTTESKVESLRPTEAQLDLLPAIEVPATPPIVLPTRGSAVTVFKTRVSARVFFGLRSSVLTPQAKSTLKFAVSKIPKNGTLEIEVIGAVQKSANTSNIVPLSTRRAQSVQNYLRTLQIQGKFMIRIMGIVGDTSKARRADTTIIYS